MLLVIPILQREGRAQTDLELTMLWLLFQLPIFQAIQRNLPPLGKMFFLFALVSCTGLPERQWRALTCIFETLSLSFQFSLCHLLFTWISLVFTYGQSSGSGETANETRPPWFPFPREVRVSRRLTLLGSPLTSVWACSSRSGFCCTLC